MGRHTKPHTGKRYQPTDEQRRHVLSMTGLGITQEDIATMLQIDHKTLYKYFRRELDTGAIEANMRVAQSLYTNATKHMNVGAQIWWTKTRMGWKAPQELTVGGNGTPIAYTFRWADAAIEDHEQHRNVKWVEAETVSAED
jgi:hypothetical protein